MIDINNRNQGSAKRLEGNIYVLCFYVGTPSNPVNEQVHVPWTQELFEAEAWLKRQAAHWGKSLDFTNATYGINGEITFLPEVIPTDPAKADAFFFPETVYRAQHFKDGWDVSEFIRKKQNTVADIRTPLCSALPTAYQKTKWMKSRPGSSAGRIACLFCKRTCRQAWLRR